MRARHPQERILGQFDDHHLLGEGADVLVGFDDFAKVMEEDFNLVMQFTKCELFVNGPVEGPWVEGFLQRGVRIVNLDPDPVRV